MNEDELAAFLEEGAGGEAAMPGDLAGRGAVDELRSQLGDERLWADPDPGGVAALLDAIRSEEAHAAGDPATTGPGQSPKPVAPEPGQSGLEGASPSHLAPRRRGRGGGGSLVAVAAAAVIALVVGMVGGLALGREDGGGGGDEFAVAGTELAPGASAVAAVEVLGSGASITLDVRDLPPAPPGTYYQAWVKSPDGDLVTVGTFHMREGDDEVDLWAGVDLDRYPTLTVTLQQEGDGQESSGQVVLTGELGR